MLLWLRQGWQDYQWRQQQDRKILKRINQLIEDTLRNPHDGLGKPEALKGELAGWWSRRIDQEHRFVYRVREIDGKRVIEIAQLRYHY